MSKPSARGRGSAAAPVVQPGQVTQPAGAVWAEPLEARFLLAFSANVNFQPAGAAVPAGYVADVGLPFGSRGNGLSYGWNADNSAHTRDRNAGNSPDQRYDTLTHLQKPQNPNAR